MYMYTSAIVILRCGCLEGMAAPFCGGYWGAGSPNLGPSKQRRCIGGVVTRGKTLVVAGPEGGACAVACVCLHAGTYKVLAQVQNTYVCKVHATPDLLTRHDLHTHI